ncbi:unnamed protein product [Phyllotreta striolata]|uniref:Carboxypeptidase n=1 Tax=Phyllotreta striolata TaxID=444603 RepID=A0A9N9XWB0_PHYSR|nr:unnamed protein product [Phyllotreta striolata]
MRLLQVVILSIILACSQAKPHPGDFFKKPIFKDFYGVIHADIKDGDAGDPLILTPLIQQNRIKEAQEASEVVLDDFMGVKSYAGYLTVDEAYGSNLFFWFFPSESNWDTDPVILWLQGGPGAPSEFGIFDENGPFYFALDGQLTLRNTSWTKSHSVVYFDQPAGTGFSFTNGGYARNQTKVGDDLYNGLYQFFQLFPNLQSNDFFITGESYGGKYVPATAHAIHRRNPNDEMKINLKGIAIGNGFVHPEYQLRYAEYLYQHGFVDGNTKKQLEDTENKAVEQIKQKNWKAAAELLNVDLDNIGDNIDIPSIYNYLYLVTPVDVDTYMDAFLAREDVRRALHVGNTVYNDGNVYDNLSQDIPKSITPWLSELLNHYRVLVYNGQTDIIVAYPMTVEYVKNLNYSSAEEYKTATRRTWKYGEDVAGYVKSAGNLTEVMVRNAGHMVPTDQPEWALDLITRFVKNDL